jgi:hypothetical protein
MDYRIGYDLDGVLCAAPPPSPKSYFKMSGPERKAWLTTRLSYYVNGKVLFTPPEDRFVAITARKFTPENLKIVREWEVSHLPGKDMAVVMFNGTHKTYETVIAFKVRTIQDYGVEQYTEDNLTVLKGIHKALPDLKLYYFDGTSPIPYPFNS